nr:phage portal protein [Aminobacter aminovorans]
MGFWRRLFGMEGKTSSLELFREIYGGGRESKAGVVVNTQTALEVSTVLACCRVIAEGVSQVPFHLYQEANGRKQIAADPLDYVLYRRPNSWQTSFEFRETVMFHTILTGNAFVFVNRVGRERTIKELIPIEPRRVTVEQRADYALQYKVSADNGETKTFGQDAIWHLRGPSWNTWMGLEATKLARNAIGLSISLEQGQSEFQKNGAKTSGALAVEDTLDKTQFELLAAWLDRHMIGGDRSHKPLILDRNAKWLADVMSAVDQQLIETRKHQIEEICRPFRVMPLMVGHPADMAARAATESIFLQHVVHCLMPWYQRLEQSADVNLLSEGQRKAGFFTKLNPNALMRGAAKDQAEYYAKALGSGGTKGWMTQNEVRDRQDMDRSDDPKADELPQPVVKAQPTPKDPPSDPASEEDQ